MNLRIAAYQARSQRHLDPDPVESDASSLVIEALGDIAIARVDCITVESGDGAIRRIDRMDRREVKSFFILHCFRKVQWLGSHWRSVDEPVFEVFVKE